MRLDKDSYIMQMLPHIAARSHDPNTQLGSVIVGPAGEIRSTGYNGLPRGCKDTEHPERLERPEKYFWMEHAERNAIYNAARMGTSIDGCILYVALFPCMDCARAIVQSGIKRLVVDEKVTLIRKNDPKWKDDWIRSEELFNECGISVDYWRCENV